MLAESITLQIDLWSLLIAELIPAILLLIGIVGTCWILNRALGQVGQALSRVGDQLAGVHRDTLGGLQQVQGRLDVVKDNVADLSTSVEVIRVQTGLTGSHTHRSVN
jgi:uncharacterized protein YoxC